jgi:hypothetical protein
MKATSFDTMTRVLAVATHRRELARAILLGGILSWLAAPARAAAAEHKTGGCNARGSGGIGSSGTPRYAATFAAAQGGTLRRLEFRIDKRKGTRADFLAQLLAVDQATGVPTNTVLAATTVPNDQVPRGRNTTVVARFDEGATTELVRGTRYAACISRPNESGQIDFVVRINWNAPCPNSRFFSSGELTDPFHEEIGNGDLLFAAFVTSSRTNTG